MLPAVKRCFLNAADVYLAVIEWFACVSKISAELSKYLALVILTAV